MPTNLPPECQKIEERYRAAETTSEKIACLEELLAAIPKHKGTDRLRADLRRKLSKLRESAQQARKKGGRQESAFYIPKEGAGQAVLVGPPNVGKSALVAALTNAAPEVAEYPLTTWLPTPGMMPIENIQVQLIDTPSLHQGYVEPQLVHMIRRADLILLVVDVQAYPIEQLEETLAFLLEHRIAPPCLQERYISEQRFRFIPLLVVVNKTDDAHLDEDYEVLQELLAEEDWPMTPVSATTGRHFDLLKQAVFEQLEIIRVYSKPPGMEPNLDAPFVLKRGGTVEEFAGKVHQDFADNLKAARVWGSALFDGQMVKRDYVLHDGDVVELRI